MKHLSTTYSIASEKVLHASRLGGKTNKLGIVAKRWTMQVATKTEIFKFHRAHPLTYNFRSMISELCFMVCCFSRNAANKDRNRDKLNKALGLCEICIYEFNINQNYQEQYLFYNTLVEDAFYDEMGRSGTFSVMPYCYS